MADPDTEARERAERQPERLYAAITSSQETVVQAEVTLRRAYAALVAAERRRDELRATYAQLYRDFRSPGTDVSGPANDGPSV